MKDLTWRSYSAKSEYFEDTCAYYEASSIARQLDLRQGNLGQDGRLRVSIPIDWTKLGRRVER